MVVLMVTAVLVNQMGLKTLNTRSIIPGILWGLVGKNCALTPLFCNPANGLAGLPQYKKGIRTASDDVVLSRKKLQVVMVKKHLLRGFAWPQPLEGYFPWVQGSTQGLWY